MRKYKISVMYILLGSFNHILVLQFFCVQCKFRLPSHDQYLLFLLVLTSGYAVSFLMHLVLMSDKFAIILRNNENFNI